MILLFFISATPIPEFKVSVEAFITAERSFFINTTPKKLFFQEFPRPEVREFRLVKWIVF